MTLPYGLRLLAKLWPCRVKNTGTLIRTSVLVLTFILYTSYHLSRRPLSVVKNVLHQNCTKINSSLGENDCNWAPFDKDDANTWLGLLDSLYLISYALFMYVAGFVAERCNLRTFITIGMLGSGFFTFLLGLAYFFEIHSFYYFASIQIVSGAFQSTGWPAAFACASYWFGSKSSRGLIFGVWSSNAFVGNILGLLVAGYFADFNWGLAFAVPAVITVVVGICMFLFLIPYPEDVGFNSLHDTNNPKREEVEQPETRKYSAVSFLRALRIPGVIEFSVCLFFSKLVSYTFLYWLPLYIRDSTSSSASNSAYLSISFDVGGIFGAAVAGYIDDRTGASAITCLTMFVLTIPALYLYEMFGSLNDFYNVGLQFVTGALVNGPYCLITTVVCTELGDKVDSNALATVSAIIDGTGSIGAAVGPFLAGLVSTSKESWHNVFYMVMAADLLALVSILRIVKHEWRRIRTKRKRRDSETDQRVVNVF